MTDYLTDAQNDIKTYLKTHDIPIRFYQCFFGELIKMFGVEFLEPDKYYNAELDDEGYIIKSYEDEYLYKDQIGFFLTHLTGTSGWDLAFKEACDQCGLMDIYDDYSHFCWVRSDIFDGYMTDEMLNVLFADTHHNDYYKFKMRKEATK